MSHDVRPESLTAIILAAGAGSRMHSDLPKPLHKVAGRSMLEHVLIAVETLSPSEVVIVASPDLAGRPEAIGLGDRARFTIQNPARGTGDAVLTALRTLDGPSTALVVYADHPLVDPADLHRLLSAFAEHQARVGLLTCTVDDAAGYGRIDRDGTGVPRAIVERVADDPAKRLGQTEINSGIQALDSLWATATLEHLPPNPQKGEVFLTDLVGVAHAEGRGVEPVVAIEGSSETLLGVNDRAELAVVDRVMRTRIAGDFMRSGVTIVGPETVYIDADVMIGRDATILPYSILTGGSSIGAGATIGPRTTIDASVIAEGATVEASIVRNSQVGANCDVGPWSHLRNETVLDAEVHVGNFVEIKKSHLSSGVRAGHFSYLGDASIGERTNIGAGTVTCNFDGVDKHPTTIGADVFIGSDSMLIAPLTIGDGAATGAGSVVTKDVEPGSKVVGVPARPIRRRTVES